VNGEGKKGREGMGGERGEERGEERKVGEGKEAGEGQGEGLIPGEGLMEDKLSEPSLIMGLPRTVKNILIVKLSSLGDIVMSLPFLATMKRKFPEARVDWVAEEPGASLLKGQNLIDRVIVFPKKELGSSLDRLRLIKFFRVLKSYRAELRDKEYDLAFDLQGLFKSGLQMFWARSEHKIGFMKSREFSSLFLDHRLPPYDPDMNALLRYLLLAEAVGASPPHDLLSRPYLSPLPTDMSLAEELLSRYPGPKAALVTGARWASKTWPLSYFARLIELLGKEGISSVLIGGPGEEPSGEKILKRIKGSPPIINLLGKTTPGLMAAILAISSITIGADSGPAHLSAAVASKTLVLFGPTLPRRTGPLTPDSRILSSPLKDCLGCLSRECPKKLKPSCMEDLSPELVLAEAMKLMED
jgi:heptosyltransferase-1/heptosyltransferase-2